MPPNLEATKLKARNVWTDAGRRLYVSFPDIGRAFRALAKLERQDRSAAYSGNGQGRFWIMIQPDQ